MTQPPKSTPEKEVSKCCGANLKRCLTNEIHSRDDNDGMKMMCGMPICRKCRKHCDMTSQPHTDSGEEVELSDAPCSHCGYNGPGYYDSSIHQCVSPPTDAKGATVGQDQTVKDSLTIQPDARGDGLMACPKCKRRSFLEYWDKDVYEKACSNCGHTIARVEKPLTDTPQEEKSECCGEKAVPQWSCEKKAEFLACGRCGREFIPQTVVGRGEGLIGSPPHYEVSSCCSSFVWFSWVGQKWVCKKCQRGCDICCKSPPPPTVGLQATGGEKQVREDWNEYARGIAIEDGVLSIEETADWWLEKIVQARKEVEGFWRIKIGTAIEEQHRENRSFEGDKLVWKHLEKLKKKLLPPPPDLSAEATAEEDKPTE